MTSTEALVQVAKDLHHLANTLELLVAAPNAEYIPTDDEPATPVVEETPVMEEARTVEETSEVPGKKEKDDLERIRKILQEKARGGLRAEVNRLLLAFGATNLKEVPKNKYPELLLAAEEM